MDLKEKNIPLIVDLDGTLIKTDLLHELIIKIFKKHPFYLFKLIIYLMKGKLYFKKKVFKLEHIDPEKLPYNKDVLSYLKEQHNKGREIILASASFHNQVNEIAEYLGFISKTYASDESVNLKGDNKLNKILEKYGVFKFDYIGNSKCDLAVFKKARLSVIVSGSKRLIKKTKKKSAETKVFKNNNIAIIELLKSMRIYQWSKNLLFFIPLFTSHQLNNYELLIPLLFGFIGFSFIASGGYLLNDLLDLEADRMHHRKKNRPLAAGNISIVTGIITMLVLFIAGSIIALKIGLELLLFYYVYLILTISYSFYFKKRILIDVIVLAALYTIRLFIGAEIIQVELSFWLLSFSAFIFFSLALVKRCTELYLLHKENRTQIKERNYLISDLSYLREMGISSGFIATIIFALYINSNDVLSLYSSPKVLWFAIPLLFYWISRIWLKTVRNEMHDDPIIFALKDKTSVIVLFTIAIIIVVASIV